MAITWVCIDWTANVQGPCPGTREWRISPTVGSYDRWNRVTHLEELGSRRREKDVTLRRDQLQFRHGHIVDEISVDDQADLDAVIVEAHDVRKDAH